MRIAAIVLAAGASRRLGQPKQLVRAGDETLLERTLRVAREAGLREVFAVLGAHAERILKEADLGISIAVENAAWETGMASSIHAGLRAALEQTPDLEAVMLLVCDQPRLTAAHLVRLIDAAQEGEVVASAYGGVPGVPAVFPASAFARLMELQGDAGARRLLQDRSVLTVAFEEGVIDVDTEEDLRRIMDDRWFRDPSQG
ncbi:MAG TPA: nucleotidyltransferase family protein [Acidobacteriaceae bacterium]